MFDAKIHKFMRIKCLSGSSRGNIITIMEIICKNIPSDV